VEDGPAQLLGVVSDKPLVLALSRRRIRDGTTDVLVARADSVDFSALTAGKPLLSV
jgi:hypothetical protein